MTTDWIERARQVAALTSGAEAALDALEAESPRPWRETVICAVLCAPRSVEVQRALEATNRWKRWRTVLPTELACTFLTLCHPNDVPLTCSLCEEKFAARHGNVFPLTQICPRCMERKRFRPHLRCHGCGAKTGGGLGFCKTCDLQIAALSRNRSNTPPAIPRTLHAMVRRRSG